MLNGAMALIAAYLLGSIPTAYLVTRWFKKQDIRQLGSGNVGAHNVFQQVGAAAGIAVCLFDALKGAAAVILASQLFDAPFAFVLLAGLNVVIGHIWPVFLKFSGGGGLAATVGVFAVLLTREMAIAFGLTAVFFVLSRNPIFSLSLSLSSIPVSVWLLEPTRLVLPYIIFTIVLLLVILFYFVPVIKADYARAGSRGKFLAELLRQDRAKEKPD